MNSEHTFIIGVVMLSLAFCGEPDLMGSIISKGDNLVQQELTIKKLSRKVELLEIDNRDLWRCIATRHAKGSVKFPCVRSEESK